MMMKDFKKKAISVLVAIALILIVGGIAFGGSLYNSMKSGEKMGFRSFLAILYPDKYAYSTEMADLNAYFGLSQADDVAIILQDELYEDQAKYSDGRVYFSMSTITKLFTNRFYYNETENTLIYARANDLVTVLLGGDNGYYVSTDINALGDFTPTDFPLAKRDNEGNVYIAADFLKNFANFEYTYFADPGRVQVYTKWGTIRQSLVSENTNVRYQGGIKSNILRSVTKGETVTVLEIMENWTKVKTSDCMIGYIENKNLEDYVEVEQTPVNTAYQPAYDYDMGSEDDNITMVFHQIYYTDDGSAFQELYANTSGIDVVSPTWFYLDSSAGTFTSYASGDYVTTAHNKGVLVWPLIEDLTNEVDEYALFSSSANRRALINNLVNACVSSGVDGINIDFEKIGTQTGPHYVQFLRELSIKAHQNGLVLSVDNYPRNEGNLYYNLKEQGYVADYVIIMAYDEHWAGSEAGSVASIDFTQQSVANAIDEGVPANKLICGIPFYTRIWRVEGAETNSEAVSMDSAANWVRERGLMPAYQEETGQNYVSYQDGTATYLLWMEDTDSVNARMSVLQQYPIAGIAAWKLGLENSGVWPIINDYWE